MDHAFIALTLVLMAGLMVAPTAAADPFPDPHCMPVYREYDFGPVRYVSPNSCEAHIWVLGHQIV